MKFKSPTETPVYLGLLSGHTLVIGPTLVEEPQQFHRMAVAEGCIPEGMASMPPAEDHAAATKQGLIVTAIKKMVAAQKKGDFNNDGRPDVSRLSAHVGFTVLAAERDTAWQTLSDDDA